MCYIYIYLYGNKHISLDMHVILF